MRRPGRGPWLLAAALGVGALALPASGVEGPAVVSAHRPREAVEADQKAAAAESEDLERRVRSLEEQVQKRRDQARVRVRALYKLSSGGWLRLLLGADNPDDLGLRHAALARLVRRDLAEMQSLGDEEKTLESERAHHQEALARAAALEAEVQAAGTAPARFLQRRGRLARPVPGSVAKGFGGYRDGRRVELVRRGVEMRSEPGKPVIASALGVVEWAGAVPGLGQGVIVDHGEGFRTVTARLEDLRVHVGQKVAGGTRLGIATGALIYFELASNGTPIDPVPWLSPFRPDGQLDPAPSDAPDPDRPGERPEEPRPE